MSHYSLVGPTGGSRALQTPWLRVQPTLYPIPDKVLLLLDLLSNHSGKNSAITAGKQQNNSGKIAK
jgi:hypothetical protein